MSVEMDSATNKKVEIYVRLLEEGTEVSRPTQALDLGNGLFRLEATVDYDPESEMWEFVPGSEVRGEMRSSESGSYLFAVKP
jgi:hypothetical protein